MRFFNRAAGDRVRPGRKVARSRRYQRDTGGYFAGRSHRRRICGRLRSRQLVWDRGAKKHATETIKKLNDEINAVVADPKIKARLVGLGVPPMSMTPTEFGKLIVDYTEKWAKVIKFAGIKLG
jgi:hypothetical protein